MGAQLSKINLKLIELTTTDDLTLSSDTIVSSYGKEDINLFLPIKFTTDTKTSLILSDDDCQIFNYENKLIKQIRNHLSLLTNTTEQIAINDEIDHILMKDIYELITNQYQRAMKDIQHIFNTKEELHRTIKEKLDIDKNIDEFISTVPYATTRVEEEKKIEVATTTSKQQQVDVGFQKFLGFSLQMLTSVLLILIRSAEKNDPSIINQILTLANQFCEQIPIERLSSSILSPTTHNLLWKPLQPLTNYINELYLSEDQHVSNQSIKILLSISIAKGSLKDILSILKKLIFNKDNVVYDVRGLLLQMNDCVLGTINSNEDASENEDEEEHKDKHEDGTEDDKVNSYFRQDCGNNIALSELAGKVDSSATSTDEITTAFDDRLERTLNSQGQYAHLGSTGKFYCGSTLDGPQCSCCNGICGPTNGCNCSACMLLDVQKRVLSRGWLVNSDGASARCSQVMPTTFYCGRQVMPDDGTSDGYCGPTNGPQCTACQRLNEQQNDRYGAIWTVRDDSSATSTDETTTVFDDRLERTLNSQGQYARLGSTGKFYCDGTLDGPQCSCCNGICGPTNGCNCSACMLLDVQKRALPRGWLVNSDGASARCSQVMPTTFYCGRKVMPDDGTSDGYCGPTNRSQCEACQRLSRQRRGRYKHIWIVNSIEQYQYELINDSISFEFHSDTFKLLFQIIEELTILITDVSDTLLLHILTVCLRLCQIHLKILCSVKMNFDKYLLKSNDKVTNMIQSSTISTSNNQLDLTSFATDDQLQKWFEILLKLICTDNGKPEQATIYSQASKALINILDIQSSSFIEKLSFIHKHIMENKHPVFVKQLYKELTKNYVLLSWIEILCNDNNKEESEQILALRILYSFIDSCFKPSNEIENEQIQQRKRILKLFQQLLLMQLVPKFRLKIKSNNKSNNEILIGVASSSISSMIIKYITYILNNYIDRLTSVKDLFNSILAGLCLMTKTNEIFDFDIIQPIFTAIIQLLIEYVFQNINTEEYEKNNLHCICWLLGKMSHVMIIGSQENLLEKKYNNKLKSILFAGGCEKTIIENNKYLLDSIKSPLANYSQFQWSNDMEQSSFDNEFLMSIYNNINQGAQLISKMKIYIKDKQRFLQKSIEQQVNDAFAAVFAVYIKYYRRINLAKFELLRIDNDKPHDKLISIYEYANYVQTLFATTKAQGGDCNELYKQIKTNALFLLSSIQESNLIPIINEDSQQPSTPLTPTTTPIEHKTRPFFNRQISRWTTARRILQLLRNTMKACIRFKKLMIAKREAIKQKFDNESILNRAIDSYIYGDSYKTIKSEEKQLEFDELIQCMLQQYKRAMIRINMYRFIQIFIEKLLNIEDQNRALTILSLYLSCLKNQNLEWSYLENIEASTCNLKEEIGNSYYSIIKTILFHALRSTTFESKFLWQNMFNLLNLSYESFDIEYLYRDQFVQTLFTSFVSYNEKSNYNVEFYRKLIGYNWFRLFVLKFCEVIQLAEQTSVVNRRLIKQQKFIFNTLILNELKALIQTISIDTENETSCSSNFAKNSLDNLAIGWFIKIATTSQNDTSIISNDLSSKFDIELCIKQWLTFLLRLVHSYEHVQSICATIDYIEKLLYIYRNYQNGVTGLLSLKILRYLIPKHTKYTSRNVIETFFKEILSCIGNSFTSQQPPLYIITELIYFYRTVMSMKSSWQMMATKLIFDTIISSQNKINLELFKTDDKNQMNCLIASLCILGGYIQPYCLASIVKVYNDEDNNEFQLALIIETNMNTNDSDLPDGLSYVIQYLETNKIETVTIDKLQIEIDVPPPNLLLLPNINETNIAIHSLFDALAYFIQIDTLKKEPVLLLQLQRHSMAVLCHILNDKTLIDIFMQKPYASIIIKLSISDSMSENYRQLSDLQLMNKQHLEQYCLSLDTYLRLNEIVHYDNGNSNELLHDMIVVNSKHKSSAYIWNHDQINRNQLIVNALSTSVFKYNGWKPYASEIEIESFKSGRIGSNELRIVPMPLDTSDSRVFEECGNNHKFKGRVSPSLENTKTSFPTYIIDDVRVSEGKWYYCVKILVSNVFQIGWATNGFAPIQNDDRGIGDDKYSWCYDGSRGVIFNDGEFRFTSDDIRWKEDDVCGCGIEIDGENICIKYWLNGKYLGKAFEHQSNITSTTTKCNMLPNGRQGTIYFPGVSLRSYSRSRCELIFSPEDMTRCPLPKGYKPLLLPKLINIENSIVAYPYSAYLIDDHVENNFHIDRRKTSTTFLRDFVNEHHLETTFTIDDHQLVLPENSTGLSLSINNDDTSSLTISFDFKILKSFENDTTTKTLNIFIITLETTEIFSVQTSISKIDEEIRTVIIFDPTQGQMIIYFNNECRKFHVTFETAKMTKFNFNIIPYVTIGIKNLGIWKYALSEEHIQRLFTYGLFYVAVDYQQLKEYRKQANTITFNKNQQQFLNELLIPFDESFEENIWEIKKKQVDVDESKYFKTIAGTDESVVQLFGNKTYLVLDKSADLWYEYTLILDICIPNWPMNNEQLTLLTLNTKSEIYITHNGKIVLSSNGIQNKSDSTLNLNEYFRLHMSFEKKFVKIYVNGLLKLNVNVDKDQFMIKAKRIDLFREMDLIKNTTSDDRLRIECKSITFLNSSLADADNCEEMKSTKYSLETLIVPPFSIVALNLIAIGYKEAWIKYVMKQYNTSNIQLIDTIIREKKEEFLKNDVQNRQKRYFNIFSRLNPSIDREKLEDLLMFSKFITDEQVTNAYELVLLHWHDLQTSKSLSKTYETKENIANSNENENLFSNEKWYYQIVHDLDVNESLDEWIQGKTKMIETEDLTYQLFDLTKSEQELSTMTSIVGGQRKKIKKSIQYSHRQISKQKYMTLRTACEHELIMIYARCTMFNMLKVWSNHSSNKFPWEIFGDCAFITTLLQLMDYHYIMLIEKVVSLLNFTLSPGQSILTDKFRAHKTYLLYSTKLQWFEQCLQKTGATSLQHIPSINFDAIKASNVDDKDEGTMFHQAYDQLHKNAQIIFRREEEQLWLAQYIGMHSTDQGGPYRDSITRICSDICSTRLSLFILCPNGRTQSGLNRDRWIPNVFPPNKSIPTKIKEQYRFIGQLMGMAIRQKHYLDLKFPILIWKQLVQEQITMEDIEAIDIQSFTIINEMAKIVNRNQSTDTENDINYLLNSIMSELHFDIVSSAGQTYELVPGGAEIPITSNNLKQYCTYYCTYRLNEFYRQIEFIRQGLYSIVPSYYLSLFTASNLEEAVCGKGQIDIELLKRNTIYRYEKENKPHIQRFWKVLSELFDEDQKKLLLIFVWGRNILPSTDEEFTSKFIINPYYTINEEVDKVLPRSHTCFFSIDLPEYSTAEIMYERLNYAITHCSSIDGDGNMVETIDLRDFVSDDEILTM
ncbi:unnamed protein product [Rotaria sordida]|uniref:Uncharacterized protein n=1 Tax=Rotaria sordida TaxID=392033 RepID=A0A819DXQ2_9BILA|nr:unnamed protein product [Rotaria sordida]